MKFAIIAVSGSQFIVSEGEEIRVDRMEKAEGETVAFDSVLLISDDAGTTIGAPTVPGSMVTGEIVRQLKGEKVRVAKYKAKSRYDKVKGFRHSYTAVKITAISVKKSN